MLRAQDCCLCRELQEETRGESHHGADNCSQDNPLDTADKKNTLFREIWFHDSVLECIYGTVERGSVLSVQLRAAPPRR